MKVKTEIRENLQFVVSYLYILLFVYAATSKLLDFQNFRVQLGQSPLLSPFADFVSVAVITLEFGIAILLAIQLTRHFALYAATALMAMFTTYIVIILNFSAFVPCSCGGILEKLGWTEHLVFNLVFVALGITAILMIDGKKSTVTALSILTIFSSAAIVTLFLFSEDIMQKENPFIRRLPQGSAAKVGMMDLNNTSYYVAGVNNGTIYLGNWRAPLHILEIDENLKTKKEFVIQLDRDDFPFRAAEVQVRFPDFYLHDGTVPVIYHGSVTDWKAIVISDKQFSFYNILFMKPDKFAYRTQERLTGENILAQISNNDKRQIQYNPMALQKQMDGVFDTDGTLQYSASLDKLVYTYYYRNQYIILNKDLTVEQRANTIDTTTKAHLKIARIKSSGDSKMAAPPYMVNKYTTIYRNLLFVNSALRGKYESTIVWKNATAVDVYDINSQTYLLSFYVHDEDTFRMKNFYAAEKAIYIISGHYLLKYGYGERITSKIK